MTTTYRKEATMAQTEAQRLAESTREILSHSMRNAVEYGKGTDEPTFVVDGTQYSPSDRALPNGDAAWQLPADDFAEWQEIVGEYIDAQEIDGWTFGWNDGLLWAYPPNYSDRGWF